MQIKFSTQKPLYFLVLAAAMIFQLACKGATEQTSTLKEDGHQTLHVSAKANRDYTVFDRVRVIDKEGFSEPAYAYSLLIPRGWTHQGNIKWILQPQTQYGNGTYNEFSAQSADGRYSIKMLPEFMWLWNSDPQMTALIQQDIQSRNVTVGEPMGAEQYLRNTFINQELQGATIDAVKPAPEVVNEMCRCLHLLCLLIIN